MSPSNEILQKFNVLEFIQHQKNVTTMLRDMLKERQISPETRRGDFLDQISIDMEKEKFLSEDFSVQLVFGGLFATFESISAVLALTFSLLAEHPSVVEELTVRRQSLSFNFIFITPLFKTLMINYLLWSG